MKTIFLSMLVIVSTFGFYQFIALLQHKFTTIWLHPMLLTILATIGILYWQDINFHDYSTSSSLLSDLLEPAVVAFGLPLYQHLETIKRQWTSIIFILLSGVIIAVVSSFIISMVIIGDYNLSIALSLKSVTTPIAIAVAEQLNGNVAITAFAIVLAGFFGAIVGPPWLTFIKVTSPKAQGLAIGSASHAIGTATVSKISVEHTAFASLSLIFSAVITAMISPFIIKFLTSLL